MSNNWKYTIKSLFRGIIVVVILTSIANFSGIKPTLLLLAIISLIGLWVQRKQLPAVIRRAKVIISVVSGTGLFFGLLFWYIYGDTDTALGLVLGTAVIIIMTLGHYDHGNPRSKQEDDLKDMALQLEDHTLPIEEKQVCPNCQAIISRNSERCSWCGSSLLGCFSPSFNLPLIFNTKGDFKWHRTIIF